MYNYTCTYYIRDYIHVHVSVEGGTWCSKREVCECESYLCKNVIGSLALSLQKDTEHKLDQVSHILKTEGAETKLVFYSILSVVWLEERRIQTAVRH